MGPLPPRRERDFLPPLPPRERDLRDRDLRDRDLGFRDREFRDREFRDREPRFDEPRRRSFSPPPLPPPPPPRREPLPTKGERPTDMEIIVVNKQQKLVPLVGE